MMVTNGKGKLEAFEDDLQPGTPFAYRNVHENELNFDYRKVQFKFKWKEGVTEEQRFQITYLLLFQPEDDPDTEETDESVENAEVVETITWNGESAESQVFSVDPDQRKSGVDGTYRLIVMDVGVDGNRDGTIAFSAPEDQTKQGTPFRFWVNDDEDKDDPDDPENVNTSNPDGDDNQIEAKRDLEDFTRLNVNIGALHEAVAEGTIQVGLKWKETSSGSPQIKVWRNLSPNGGTQYLSDDGVAAEHLNLGNPGHIQGSSSYIIPTQFWEDAELSASQPFGYLLFEGVEEGKGRLVVTLHDSSGAEIGEGAGVWLDIKNIKKMYERNTSNQFVQPWDETQETIVFVHGWKMSPEGSTSFAETMYKRVWHRGYKGRFAYFRWNTDYSGFWSWLPYVGQAIDSYLSDYNGSEETGWNSGDELKTYVDSLPYVKNIAAHSMGNIVVGSALTQGMSINNYAMMQAAVPASCYDDTTNVQQTTQYNHTAGPLTFTMWDANSPDADTDPATRALTYRGRFAGVSGSLINFYLPDDFATSFAWEVNNDQAKPPRTVSSFAERYEYAAVGAAGQKLYKYYIESNPGDPPTQSFEVDYYLTDPVEAMAYACRAWSKAVGADGGTGGSVDSSVNLGSSQFQLPGNPANTGFDERHSGQFNYNIQDLMPFYNSLLDALEVDYNNGQ